MWVFTDLSIPSLVNGLANTPFMPDEYLAYTHDENAPQLRFKLTMLEIAIHFIWSDVRSHCNDWYRGAMLANIHGCRDTVETGHDNIHEHHVEVISANAADSVVGVGTVLLCRVSCYVLPLP